MVLSVRIPDLMLYNLRKIAACVKFQHLYFCCLPPTGAEEGQSCVRTILDLWCLYGLSIEGTMINSRCLRPAGHDQQHLGLCQAVPLPVQGAAAGRLALFGASLAALQGTGTSHSPGLSDLPSCLCQCYWMILPQHEFTYHHSCHVQEVVNVLGSLAILKACTQETWQLLLGKLASMPLSSFKEADLHQLYQIYLLIEAAGDSS